MGNLVSHIHGRTKVKDELESGSEQIFVFKTEDVTWVYRKLRKEQILDVSS